MTGMGVMNFESQAKAATKGNLKFLPSSDSMKTDESLKDQYEPREEERPVNPQSKIIVTEIGVEDVEGH